MRHDRLTGLPGRAQFQAEPDSHLAVAAAESFGVPFIDLDRFKRVNAGWWWGALVSLAHAFDQPVAAGLEKEEQLALVRALGCDSVAGYQLARPAPAIVAGGVG